MSATDVSVHAASLLGNMDVDTMTESEVDLRMQQFENQFRALRLVLERLRTKKHEFLRRSCKVHTFTKCDIDRDCLQAAHVRLGSVLGEGAFGVVYEGVWRGFPMAVKMLLAPGTVCSDELLKECDLLAELEHPNVMKVYGLCVGSRPRSWPPGPEPPCLCCELLSGGTFLQFLKAVPAEARQHLSHWSKIVGMLLDAAKGLCHLHSQQVMHQDLKSANLLLDHKGTLKLADFGLAACREDMRTQQPQVGTWTHMAPEILNEKPYDISADIFSFGIVFSEAVACAEAEDLIDDTRTKKFELDEVGLASFLDPDVHPLASFDLVHVAALCCKMDSCQRPSAFRLVAHLQVIESDQCNPTEDSPYIIERKENRDRLIKAIEVLERSHMERTRTLSERSLRAEWEHHASQSMDILKRIRSEDIWTLHPYTPTGKAECFDEGFSV
mmetsp:Transcript_28288/g.74639  ORF Transcript_28288/g.74639 Transcript_28288/m.74639 type:complete len:441 (-) Transcript_28288:256-1578(-)